MGPKVLGALGGRDMPPDLLERWARSADVVIAADSGADVLIERGIHPLQVVGDLDSTTSKELLAELEAQGLLQLVHDPSQQNTDCDKLLDIALREGYDDITLAGVEGDQLDHMLATLHSAARSPLRVRVALRNGVGWILRDDQEVKVATEEGRRVSLLPLAPAEGVTLRGVEWPLERSEMNPLGKSSISNKATGDEVFAHLWEGAAFLFVEYDDSEVPFW